MNKIASFTVNHLDLLTGVYVSRKDYIGDVCLTTFDLRFTRPNEEPPMDTPGIHDNTPIPGYSPRDCGNYLDNNLKLAKIYMRMFKDEVLDNPVPERLKYPQ